VTAQTSEEPAILLIEDDDTIGRHLVSGLRSHGYPIRWCRTGASALTEIDEEQVEIVLLDLGLPDMDGLDVARDLRQGHPQILLIMLTARGEDIDVVAGLDVGADDYLVKPVGLSVLLARLRAHRRRVEHHPPPDADAGHLIQVGALTVDLLSRRCLVAEREVSLRPKEFDLLTQLAQHAGSAIRREDLMAAVWDENWFGSTKTLDVTMAALRQRLEQAHHRAGPHAPPMPVVTTLRGHGYRLDLMEATRPPLW
jgi:DNA-binding response OmpR family regulator